MRTTLNLMKACTFAVSLLVFPGAKAEVFRWDELICSGMVTYDQDTFSDQIILRLSNGDIDVSGEPGMTNTFEGGHRYTICFESENEVDFEYTTSSECGNNATRTGRLHKVVGSLRLTRSDRGKPFVGAYKCKPAQRIIK